ncbi:GyrI-like domain-containing protein [Rhodococcus opacus]|uniref:GyrI-like domain-containing protein n=1 Tax=Rhodococcus opacus TaxID=37919 RepID=UPI00223655CB|nr:GyrI-like domain-containing protein [Rhodococcus opacus]MDJ0416307.1 GyrI-like domain-containing protein [Rhodococcus opacus]UZG58551.1 GyrI-like domain-containing protein [Rhodococcus opacus]
MIEIVKRQAESFVGLTIPEGKPGRPGPGRELVDYTVERIRDRGISEIFVVYAASPPPRTFTVVVGYPCDSPDKMEPGDVLVGVRAGYFARFCCEDESEPDALAETWSVADYAAARGRIERAFTEDLEVHHPDGSVDLFLSLH